MRARLKGLPISQRDYLRSPSIVRSGQPIYASLRDSVTILKESGDSLVRIRNSTLEFDDHSFALDLQVPLCPTPLQASSE